MTTYVALLRGVNVSGHNKVPMATLRALCSSHGLENVATYLQSGNVVFTTRGRTAAVEAELTSWIAAELGLEVTVIVRTAAQLAKVAAAHPLDRRGTAPTALHVTFLARAPDRARLRAIDPKVGLPDEFAVRGREVYLRCPDGYGRSKLDNSYFEKQLGVRATTRNWRTVGQLASMAAAT